jgi:ubiquinone/menaquinone biosynthesis C-methylase UbiE
MDNSEFKRIKQKMMDIDPIKYWGDDFDVRFYLISKLKNLKNSKILDIGGGIGVISSEIAESNFVVNVDFSFKDLLQAKEFAKFENLCATMVNLPFTNSSFDYVICSHVIEVAKNIDLKENNKNFPTIARLLFEINRVLRDKGRLILTTPNNEYYKSKKLDYSELKSFLNNMFQDVNIKFFNTYPRLSSKYKKLNLANVVPKILFKSMNKEKILNHLVKQDKGKKMSSVSFYVEAIKYE